MFHRQNLAVILMKIRMTLLLYKDYIALPSVLYIPSGVYSFSCHESRSPVLGFPAPTAAVTPKWLPLDPVDAGVLSESHQSKGTYPALPRVDCSLWQWVSLALCLLLNGHRVEEACVGLLAREGV